MQGYRTNFREKLQKLINETSQENFSNTPDYILADYLMNCLFNFEAALRSRDDWRERNGEEDA